MKVEVKDLDTLKRQFKGMPLILFGAGGCGERILEYCRSNSISVDAFCDNLKTEPFCGLKVISPNVLKQQYVNANIIVSSIIHSKAIHSCLLDMGYNENQIFSYSLFMATESTWNDIDTEADWERMKKRVIKMAEWIDGNDKSIIDFGSGQMFLKTLLQPNVSYYPVDYIKRSEETIVCDFNKGKFPDIIADVSFLSGVLEFINPIEELIEHICKNANHKVVLSYITLERFSDIKGRLASAYVNSFTRQNLVDLFDGHGFSLTNETIGPGHDHDTLFCFVRNVRV